MSRTLKVVSLTILLVSFGAIAFADSHEPAIYVWINFMKAKPGQGDALIGMMMEENAKSFDPLVESGAALEWGIAMPVVHDGGDPASHIEWVTFVGWDGMDEFMNAFMARRQATSEEDRMAADERWRTLVEPGSHMDMINRSVHIGSGSPARPGYIHVAYWTAHPGKAGAAGAAYQDMVAPIYDQLVADGAIQNYGLHVPGVHRGQGWTHMSWFMSENLAARDAVRNAFGARSEEDQKRLMTSMMENFEPGHEDQILMVVHHKTASGGDD